MLVNAIVYEIGHSEHATKQSSNQSCDKQIQGNCLEMIIRVLMSEEYT